VKRLRALWAMAQFTIGPFLLFGGQALLRTLRALAVKLRRITTFHVGVGLLWAGLGTLAGVTIAVAAHFIGSAALWGVAGAWLMAGGIVLAGDELEITWPWVRPKP
jgi:hypothetical protein